MSKTNFFLFTTIYLLILSSCSHLQSGKYVQIRETDTIEKLGKEFNVSPRRILASNKGVPFQVGKWYFIPQEVGFARHLTDEVDFGHVEGVPNMNIYVGKLLWPVPASTKISSKYGKRWGRNHEGIDIPGRKGTVILAAEDGKVIYSGNGLKGYGNLIIVAHKNGLRTVYAHNKKNLVKKGHKVHRGQVIGHIGATGHATGPHVHFEVRYYDKPVNPMAYIERSRSELVSYKQ